MTREFGLSLFLRPALICIVARTICNKLEVSIFSQLHSPRKHENADELKATFASTAITTTDDDTKAPLLCNYV